MKLLLDTHVAIWALTAPDRISAPGRALIGDVNNEVFFSAASIWEISIKYTLGRTSAPPFSGAEAAAYFMKAGYRSLSITAAHAAAVEELPRIHTDPFDRLLVAQAVFEPLRLLTHDARVAAYSAVIMRV